MPQGLRLGTTLAPHDRTIFWTCNSAYDSELMTSGYSLYMLCKRAGRFFYEDFDVHYRAPIDTASSIKGIHGSGHASNSPPQFDRATIEYKLQRNKN